MMVGRSFPLEIWLLFRGIFVNYIIIIDEILQYPVLRGLSYTPKVSGDYGPGVVATFVWENFLRVPPTKQVFHTLMFLRGVSEATNS